MVDLLYRAEDEDFVVGNCCAIASLQNFPCDDDLEDDGEFRDHLLERINTDCRNARADGKSLVLVTLNTQQELSGQLLEEAGFVCPQENWAYRDPKVTGTKTGVKVFLKTLVPERVA